jgi:hypothetical protein
LSFKVLRRRALALYDGSGNFMGDLIQETIRTGGGPVDCAQLPENSYAGAHLEAVAGRVYRPHTNLNQSLPVGRYTVQLIYCRGFVEHSFKGDQPPESRGTLSLKRCANRDRCAHECGSEE